MSEVTNIESGRARRSGKNPTVEQQARAYKARAITILGNLMDLLREAEAENFRIEFEIKRDSLEWPIFLGPTVVKRFP